MLNSGYEMPILGIGTYQLSNSQAENSVYWALRDGYRLIDTARIYGNEEGVGRGNTTTLFNDETISSIAAAHNKTSAQIILRWHLQADNIAIPGSSNEAHIAENYDIFDFKLTDEEMQRLTDIDKNTRFASY